MPATPFRVDTPQPVLDDLKARLAAVRWPDQPAGQDWRLGTELGFLRRLCEHWRVAEAGRRRSSSTAPRSTASGCT